MLKSRAFFEGHFWRAQKVDELRIGIQKKKKKLMPSIWGEDGEKKAMKENLHCVESHEAESALFFGGLESGGLQGPGRMEKKSYEGESALC